MKIIIDAYQYLDSITGTDRMAKNYLVGLQTIDQSNEYTVICSREPYVSQSITAANFCVKKPPIFCSTPLLGRYMSFLWRMIIRYWLSNGNYDVYFSFHNMTLPKTRIAKRMIASNLDLIPILLPDYQDKGRIKGSALRQEFSRVVDLADTIVAISKFSRDELTKTFKAAAGKVRVIPLAADPQFAVDDKSGLGDKNLSDYFLTLGGSEPRKNVQLVIDAYLLLPETIQSQYKLLIAGGKWHNNELQRTENPGIKLLGYVPDKDLPQLYAQATAFIFPSYYEGFGFTILEAMACGAPVISAQGSSLDEVAGNATLTFDPQDKTALATNMVQIIENTGLRSELKKKGFDQNKKFSWQKSARQLLAVLNEVN